MSFVTQACAFPQITGHDNRIDPLLCPPYLLIAHTMNRAMVDSTERHVLVADFAAKCPAAA
jgi:hypothetical protein